jgi:hypothetical protein
MLENFLSQREIVRRTGLPETALRRLIASGQVSTARVPGSSRTRVSLLDVQRLIEAETNHVTPGAAS